MTAQPQAAADPGGASAPKATVPAPQAASTGVDDDPQVRRAKVELELERIAADKARLALTDQSERAKLLKEMTPDFGSATVEKDATTASTTPPSLSESVIARAAHAASDDIADLIIEAITRCEGELGKHPAWTLLVTSDTAHLSDAAARRDVLMRLHRVREAIDATCSAPVEPENAQDPGPRVRELFAAPMLVPLLTAGLSALPGAITLATRLFAQQYTTSSHTSALSGAVDMHTAGALTSRIRERPSARVFLARFRPATDTELRNQLLDLAHDLDGCVADALESARIRAAVAAHHLDTVAAHSATLAQRASDLYTAWKDKVGKSAASAGLSEDLALIKALKEAIAATNDDDEKKNLTAVLTAVQARVDAVLKHLADGDGDIGTEQLLEMLATLDGQASRTAVYEQQAKDVQARADEHVAKLIAVRTAGTDLLEALASTDSNGDRLIDKAARAAVLDRDDTLVVFAHLHHGGADTVEDNKTGTDYRTTVGAATVEWALLAPDGAVIDGGVRTVRAYLRAVLSDPAKSSVNLIDYVGVNRATLPSG